MDPLVRGLAPGAFGDLEGVTHLEVVMAPQLPASFVCRPRGLGGPPTFDRFAVGPNPRAELVDHGVRERLPQSRQYPEYQPN